MRLAGVAAIFLLIACAVGCANSARPNHSATTRVIADPLFSPQYIESIDASAMPPIGWQAEMLKSSATHTHQVWLSPTGRTAYGVIHFNLPLPVGHDLALWGFLQNMKKAEGEAKLIEKRWDDQLGGLRFVAAGGLYRVRTNLFVRGLQGWAVYAGTLQDQPIEADMLELAERAREATHISH